MRRIWGNFFLLVLLISCSSKPCNNTPQKPIAEPSSAPAPYDDEEGATPVALPSPAAKTLAPSNINSVKVYKATGEQQCGMGSHTKIDDMKATLINKKIQVFDATTRPDGRMHMAVCGAPTGMVHVFTIPSKNLKAAERLGFKRWQENN